MNTRWLRLFYKLNIPLACVALYLTLLCCVFSPSTAQAESTPLIAHTAWQKLDALAADFPFAWARRYHELKVIAEDADGYAEQLPSLLHRLHQVTTLGQKEVVTMLLDLVPAQANVQESNFIVGLLQKWRIKLEAPLRHTEATNAGIGHAREVLADIGQAVEEMQANPNKRPIMEKASQDFYELYLLTNKKIQQLNTDLHAVRSVTLELYNQIETAITTTEETLPAKWFAYYTTPLTISTAAVSRLGTDFITMCKDWLSDESTPESIPFTLMFNFLVVGGLMLTSTVLSRIATTAPPEIEQRTFAQSLCCEFRALDTRHRLAFDFCLIVMLNSIVDNLPQFHQNIPFLFMQQLFMIVALAIWARNDAPDPKVWELALPLMTGHLLLHGDASPILMLIGMAGALLLPLVSLLSTCSAGLSELRVIWITALFVGLILTILGFGRLSVPLLMLIVTVNAAAAMLGIVNNSPALLPYTMTRAWFVPIFTLFLCVMSVSFLVACPGFATLHNYWYENALPIMGFKVTFGNAVLSLLVLLGAIFLSKISRQVMEKLGNSQVLDESAIPVLHVVVNCFLLGIFVFFVMSSLGVDVSSLAFIGGGVSIGVGFAAKTVLSNFFCGLVIIFSKMVRAGDVVEVSNITGKVLSVNMRATVVETLNNGILLVPNEEMLSSRLTNWSLNNLHVLENINVSIDVNNDLPTALSAMEDAAASVAGIMRRPAPKALFTDFGEDSMNCILKVYVSDVRIKAAILSEVRKALYHTLAERGVALSMLVNKKLDINLQEH